MKRIALIAAMDRKGCIGRNNDLPWKLPEDLKHFKTLTLRKPIIMGRKTFDSLGRPLPQRLNIVITRNHNAAQENVVFVASLEEAIQTAQASTVQGDTGDEIMVIGGGQIYELAMPLADRLYITHVDTEVEGDAHFPSFDMNGWLVTEEDGPHFDDEAGLSYRYKTYDRKL